MAEWDRLVLDLVNIDSQARLIGLINQFTNPRIILLDEADAHLDKNAGKVLNRILSQYKGTIIWVTHKLDRLNSADCIWNIEKGNLVNVTPQRQLRQSAG
jgi:ABC-type bacteriocin/lantibiotic exporter with double-glycine peptidase domain